MQRRRRQQPQRSDGGCDTHETVADPDNGKAATRFISRMRGAGRMLCMLDMLRTKATTRAACALVWVDDDLHPPDEAGDARPAAAEASCPVDALLRWYRRTAD
eukprot:4312280-Pleurochrysis_carterae.AAC.1